MKKPLARFTQFATNLFPHEVYYLQSVQNFQNPENHEIMAVMLYNLEHRQKPKPYPTQIDKRKYSNLKKWIEQKLEEANVDEQLRNITRLETKVLLDEVDLATEKELMRWLKLGTPRHHYFRKIYELLRHYEHFLLIRLREKADETVNAYLQKYRSHYEQSETIFQKLQSITSEIVGQYHQRSSQLKAHEHFLREVLYHPQLDGMNQYAAFVRLAFIYLNTGQQKPLEEVYAFMDESLKQGRFYSRRMLANFYANRLLMLSRFSSLNEAEQFGYLSLRFKNTDYLFYLTNLSAVLLRQGKSEEALQLLREAFPEMRQTSSRHTKVGFIAFYLKCMTDLGRAADAEDFAESYLKAYPKEVLGGRWHLFFVAYFRTLMVQEKYGRLLYLTRRFKILQREKSNRNRPNYLPTISWYVAIARYVDEAASTEDLKEEMNLALTSPGDWTLRKNRLLAIFEELRPVDPKVIKNIKSALLEKI
jgi:hypothetical protein